VGEAGDPTGPARGAGKRERTKAGNRAAILVAARGVFADLGYESTTIRDVIRATDLAAGTFYNYFRDKESVLRALLEEKMTEMQQRARDARRDATTVEEVVRSTVDLSFTMLIEDRPVFDLLRRNAGAIRAILDEPSFVANLDELRRDLERVLGRTAGSRVDAEYLTAAISGIAFEVAAVAVDRSPHELSRAADFATRLLLGGIAGLSAGAGPSRRRAGSPAPSPRSDSKPSSTSEPRRTSANSGRTPRATRSRTR
jgi:AcrR family transcriptional regulator